MADERFSIAKFFSSFTQALPWIKTLRYAIGIALILGVCLFVYFRFFAKQQIMTNVFKGKVEKVEIHQNPKKALIPFVEGGVEKNNRTDFETYLRAGLRWEF